MHPRYSFALALVAILVTPAIAFAAAHAELRPGTEIAVGAPAELSITVDGEANPPATPRLAGAQIQYRGEVAQTSIINGDTTQQTIFSYLVVPDRAGALEIPAISVVTADGVSTTEAIHAIVTSAASPRTVAGARTAAPAADPTRAFMTLEVPAKSLVVGQAVPIKIHAYFRGGTSVTLQGNPVLAADAFTLADLSDKPGQAQIEIHGEPYLEATWTAVLSPAKPSNGKLSVELPVELAYRQATRPAAGHSLQDLLDSDPFAAQFFNGADPFANGADPFADIDSMLDEGPEQRYQTTLRAGAGSLTVADLPADKPAGFTGAVGHFEVALDPVSGEPRVGEPLTLAIRVTGTGNFDRVAMTGVPGSETMKTYPTKSAFVSADAHKLTGTKTFTQTVVPTRAGEVTIPALTLVSFDPDKHAFVTVETSPQTLAVAPARGGGSADPGLAASVRDPGMNANRLDPGGAHATLQPLFRQPRFVAGLVALAALTMLLAGIGWWRRSPRIARVLQTRHVDRAVAGAAAEMDRAARDNDRVAFFGAARRALQIRLAASWHQLPEAITAHDVSAHLGERGQKICSVFEQADEVAYGSATLASERLDLWRTMVSTELANLETSS